MLGQLIPLALVVAMSPLTIIPAIVLVLQSDRARFTGLAFMSGWLLGLAATTAVFVQLPRLLDGLNRPAPTWAAWVRIAVGIALIAFGVWRWLTRHQVTRQPAWLNRLMNRLRREPEGERFEDVWVKDQAAEARRRVRNDEVWTGAGR